ncbi:unnamed protein product [Brachionus calyciflorus]|uniref:Alpha-type protein kinase domain-containing protein n=1 Tax=Brachionus calyciflorus TaxID=104777 RepID=A0A814A8I0_9BILA|nr:unnamed protein product [Brachionus calyciflorus]
MDLFEEDEIFPLTENLSSSFVDTSKLLTYVAQSHPIGMSNFRTKKQIRVENTPNLAKYRWQMAAHKLKKLKDPWAEFHIDDYPCETVIRHRYNAIKKDWIKDECKVKIENKQFANGAMRACFRLKKLSNFVHKDSWEHAANYVAKCFKDPEVPRERYFDEVRLQMDAKLWAEIFNRHNPPKKIDMFQMSILEFVNRPGSPLFHLEHFIEGEYIKYNSNSGFVDDKRCTPQAFSHFTFECSNHELMVVDIQGVGDLYTDPQIHTAKGDDYGDGNLGCKGFALFFSSHVCNKVCKSIGLTEFDLSPNELGKLNSKKSQNTVVNFSTICRGREELVVGSPTSYSEFLRKRIRNMSTCSDDIESEGYESSTSSPMLSPNSSRPMQIPMRSNPVFINSPQRRIRTESNCLDSAFSYDEAASYFNKIDARKHFKPRPSCVHNERDLLNGNLSDEEEVELNSIQEESILGKTHLEMAKYHECGRFSENETDEYDQESAFFHLKQSADLGVKEAIVNIAKIYLGLPHDLLASYQEENIELGFNFLIQGADHEDKNSLFNLAKAYDTGVNLPNGRKIDWNLASCYYKKLLQVMEDDSSNEDAGYSEAIGDCDPCYLILARLAEMNLNGGNNLAKSASEAASLYTEAADKAMQYGKGRIANKYYMLAEEAASQED